MELVWATLSLLKVTRFQKFFELENTPFTKNNITVV